SHQEDRERVIPKLRTVRQVETPRVYDQYLKYAGKLVAGTSYMRHETFASANPLIQI
ncbi:hypothetical protein HDU99_001767, partial [Rhizoclosmatium hyalinum]